MCCARADTLITARTDPSPSVSDAAVAAKLGLHCAALLEKSIGTRAENYLSNGIVSLAAGSLLTQVEMCDALTDPAPSSMNKRTRIEARVSSPYVVIPACAPMPLGASQAM